MGQYSDTSYTVHKARRTKSLYNRNLLLMSTSLFLFLFVSSFFVFVAVIMYCDLLIKDIEK